MNYILTLSLCQHLKLNFLYFILVFYKPFIYNDFNGGLDMSNKFYEKEFNDIFSKNLRHYLKKTGTSQNELARIIDVSPTSVNNWCNGYKTPRMDKVDKICAYFHITRADLMQEQASDKPKGVRIPVLGNVVAGVPIDAIEEFLDWEEITPELAETGDFFALKIKGDSMEPRIVEGDVVIVKMQSTADTGDVVIAMVNGDDACCKRFIKHDEGITLQSFNPSYTPMFFTKKEIESLPVTIIGKVIENRQKY